MMSDGEREGFLSRWSRRKAQEAAQEPTQVDEQPAPLETDEPPPPGNHEPEESAEPLPDPETLDRNADWSRFLARDVPAGLRARALRRLWRLDPVFANLDGLVDYAEDYNSPAFTGRPVKTLFQVGRGMLPPEIPSPKTSSPEMSSPEQFSPDPSAESTVSRDQPERPDDRKEPEDQVEGVEVAASFDEPEQVGRHGTVRQEGRSDEHRPRRATARRWHVGRDPAEKGG